MKLKKFIKNFVEHNTLIRLQYKINGGHKEVGALGMEHELKDSIYANHKVVGVTDILVRGRYAEAVNLTIERKVFILPCGCSSKSDPVYYNSHNEVFQCHKCGEYKLYETISGEKNVYNEISKRLEDGK